MTIFSDKPDQHDEDQPSQSVTAEPSVDDVLPDAEAEVTKLESDVEHPAHELLGEIERFFDTFEVKTEDDLAIAKGWIKMQVAKVRAVL
jgi:hypothetical protein